MTDQNLLDKLAKILALTTSPVEGEAQAAAAMLAKLLAKHNLQMADLEAKGAAKPGVIENRVDLGKAAFQWKIDLATFIAEHYFCKVLILKRHRRGKVLLFLGRPDNVQAFEMLYRWLVEQVQRIAKEERRTYIETTGDHVDPLRWQVNFGMGAAQRLGQRLGNLKRQQAADTKALVIHHAEEIDLWTQQTYGTLGKPEKRRHKTLGWQETEALLAGSRAANDMNLQPFLA